MELNRNPDDYFAELEQAAFSPSNIVPGISFSPDKMLQARIFSYADAHRHRLGTHYENLPANIPRCPVRNYYRDGEMNYTGLRTGNPDAYYEPSSFDGPVQDSNVKEPPLVLSGAMDRYDHRQGNDDHGQVRVLYDLFDDEQKQRLYTNIAEAMAGVPDDIIRRQLALFAKVHPDYAAGVKAAL